MSDEDRRDGAEGGGDAPTRPAGESHTRTLDTAAGAPAGERRIGPYRLLREIGHGGMGTVYLAVRADEQFHKRVAVKVVRGGDSAEVVRHFRRERQILAGLEHAHIAHLLDGGTTEDGLPYFVMEYVEGQPIDRYCDGHGLTVTDVLVLFQQACDAVQHAHRNLVVHRDLKPSNILVTADGLVKLLDFGIAKLLNPELSGEAPTATGLAMTPEYASPEQVRGEPITTATDVYSLGVVLYRLLTGRLPYRLDGRPPLDVLRAVCEEEPERPSLASGRRHLRGDLDNIVLSALCKEPHRRYPSVEALSEDIRRHLEGRPVRARRSSWGYRLLKFVGRNRVAVGAVSLLILLLAGAVAEMAVAWGRAAHERDRAQREREKAERVAAFLVDLFRVSDPREAKGRTVTAREVLDRGARRIDTELRDQPEVRATLLDTLGVVHSNLGFFDEAQRMLEEAAGTRTRVLGPDHPDVMATRASLASVLALRGDYAGSETLYRQVLAQQRRVLGEGHGDVARVLGELGNVLSMKGSYSEAEALHRESLALKRRVHGEDHEAVAQGLNNLANVLHGKGDSAGAEALYREALAKRRRLRVYEHPHTALALGNLGNVLKERGDLAGAETSYREALELQRGLLGEDHPDVAWTLSSLGDVLEHKGDLEGAERVYREALAVQRRRLGEEHPDAAFTLLGLGRVLGRRGRNAEAEPLLRRALALFRRGGVGRGAEEVAEASGLLGGTLVALGRHAQAEPLLLESYASLAPAGNAAASRAAVERLVSLYETWGRPREAAEHRRRLEPPREAPAPR
ncbi:MAG: serine/threonine protein kinase [Acidobacteria bacterium]|nr:serine/threonine protein kinase [Acidobacteriota bacterium]